MMMMCSVSLCFKGSKDEKKVLFVFDRKKTFLISSLTKGLFHKTFFFVIHYKLAINYKILAIYEKIYGQNLAVTTNP